MKYFVCFTVFVFVTVTTQAQTHIPMLYTYKQKQLNDTLGMLFPDLQSKEVPLQNNMPVLPLNNEGVKVSSSSIGELYSMNVDKMPCLKPFKIEDKMRDAIKPKTIIPVIPKEKY